MPRPTSLELGGTGRNDGIDASFAYFTQAGSTVERTVSEKLAESVSPGDFGAVGDGVADDSAAFTAALLYSRTLDLSNRSWKLASTITLPAGTVLDMRGANIIAATGATPVFQFLNGSAGLYILHGGGQVTGTASCFLFAQGTTNTPTSQSHYASQIHLESLWINSDTITTALVFDKAVKSVYINGPNFFTPNGIDASGKCVEVMVSNHIIYGATGAAGTAGVKLRSTGGTTYYNEGWSFVNGTIDNFEISHDVTDCFVYQVTGGYTGAASGGYAFQFQAPSANLCEEIFIDGGAVIGSRIRFATAGAGQAYHATIDAMFNGVAGTAVALENNTSNVTIKGKFKNGTGTAIAVVGTNNNHSINTDVEVDSTYTNGVVLNGANGADCYVDVCGPSSGDIIGAGRANIRYGSKVPQHSVAVVNLLRTVSAANLGGGATYAVGVNIASIAWGFGRGERGFIEVRLPYSGANAATQNVQIGVPTGMVLDSGTGYSAVNLYLGAAAGRLSELIPYTCTADGSGNVTVLNQAGNTLTIANQAYCGVRRA
jgi:hypothetical protein